VETSLPTSPEPVVKPAPEPPQPKSPRALLAEATRMRLRGSVERALDLYGQVVSAQPDNAEALAGRGLCYLDLSRYAPAEASFQAALRVDPEQADALLGLAETYRSQGRRADAIQYFEKYLAFYPDGDEAAVARNAIAQLRD
jgi:tetratricopeptide (TPR) repeat protein